MKQSWLFTPGTVSGVPEKSTTQQIGTFTQCCFNVGSASQTVGQHWNIIGWMPRVCWSLIPASTGYRVKIDLILAHRLQHLANIDSMPRVCWPLIRDTSQCCLNAGQAPQRVASIEPTLGQLLVLATLYPVWRGDCSLCEPVCPKNWVVEPLLIRWRRYLGHVCHQAKHCG